MTAILLLHKITVFFLIMMAGAAVVRTGVLKSKDSRVLSALLVYVSNPCAILSAFQVSFDSSVAGGLMLAFAAAFVVNLLSILLAFSAGKIWKLNATEKASVIYSNAGALVIPLVSYVMGDEYVIYTM